MSPYVPPGALHFGFPRFFRIGRTWVNSYKVFLIVGIYVGSLTSAALAGKSGLSPLGLGLGTAICALAGVIGARVYDLVVNVSHYRSERSWRVLWEGSRGGLGVFGALVTVTPSTMATAWLLELPAVVVWDHMSAGVLAGGFWVRLGCVFNGCCAGRETQGRLGVRLHDDRGIRKRRVPVQFMEMVWWLLGGAGFLWLWCGELPPGSYALGVLAWYGVGRFFLEPMRERCDIVLGVRINQVVAGLLALTAGGALALLGLNR